MPLAASERPMPKRWPARATTWCWWREERRNLRALATELREAHGIWADFMVADLSKSPDIDRVADRIRKMDDLDILINNASTIAYRDFADSQIKDYQEIVNVHLMSMMSFAYAFK